MAEVAVAIANAASSIAIAAAVGAVVALVYAIWQDVYSLVPIAGSIGVGALFALVFNKQNPFLGMGLGVSAASLVYLPIETVVATNMKGAPQTTGVEMARSVRTIAQISCAGAALGFTEKITGSLSLALAAAAGAFYLGGKYAWTPMVNFYLEMGFFGSENCGSKNPSTTCVGPCTKAANAEKVAALWAQPPCKGVNNGAVADWCNAKSAYIQQCAWDMGAVPDPGDTAPPPNSVQTPPTSKSCRMYTPYVVRGDPNFYNVCPPYTGKSSCGDFTSAKPVSVHDFGTWYITNYGQPKWGDTWLFARNPDGSWQDGLVMYQSETGKNFHLGGDETNHLCGAAGEYGASLLNDQWMCMYAAAGEGQNGWQFAPAQLGQSPNPVRDVLNYFEWDFTNSKTPGYNSAGLFQNHRACVPTELSTDGNTLLPRSDLDQQPVEADRGSFCSQYDKNAKKPYDAAMVVQFPASKQFQCRTAPRAPLSPSYGVAWPW